MDEHRQPPAEDISSEIPGTSSCSKQRQAPPATDECSNVVNAPLLAEPDEVADQLEAVRLVWLRSGDEKTLRRALLDLLRQLEDGSKHHPGV